PIRKMGVRDGRAAPKNAVIAPRFLGCARRKRRRLCRSSPAHHAARLAYGTRRRPRACQAKAPCDRGCGARRDQRAGIATREFSWRLDEIAPAAKHGCVTDLGW